METKDIERNIKTLCEDKYVKPFLVAQQMLIDTMECYYSAVGGMYGDAAEEKECERMSEDIDKVNRKMTEQIGDAIFAHLNQR